MLITREELRFNFNGAQFNSEKESERKLLAWIFNQFLYGEASGIQCGYWLYRAPHLNAALFLAKQASEELSHFRRILRIFTLLGEKPEKAHWAIRFLASGMMGSSWGEHVTIEMALGEGLVLGVFYAMTDTIPHPEIQKILSTATVEEERHVEFGERETTVWIKEHPNSKKLLMGLALVQVWILHGLKKFVLKKLHKELGSQHPVMNQFEAFYDHVVRCFELRIERLSLSPIPLSQLTWIQKLNYLGLLPFRICLEKLKFKKPLLTETYLGDSTVVSELQRSLPSSSRLE
jgi:1,2-phenylacetyl-CoA epoxidase catalytic subunit